MSPTYQFFSQLAETWVLIYFFVLFVAVLVYALWPSRQKQFDEAARMPRGRTPPPPPPAVPLPRSVSLRGGG